MNGSTTTSYTTSDMSRARSPSPVPSSERIPYSFNHHLTSSSPPPPFSNGTSDDPSTSPSLSKTQAGKSGRVIENLMAVNDRLRRELKVETTAREEERKAKEAIRQSRDSLQATNDNLVLQNNTIQASLSRKDRKIEELKGERDWEKEHRLEAERNLGIRERQNGEEQQAMRQELANEAMERKRVGNQYEVLQRSWKDLDDGYRGRVEKLGRKLEELQELRERDLEALERLEVTVEQQRQELEKLRLAKRRIEEKCTGVLEEAEDGMKFIREHSEGQLEVLDRTVEEAKSVVGGMKHIVAVKENLRET